MSSSGTTVTEISTPFSSVGGGGTISSATNKPLKDETIVPCPFRVGEEVLAFYNPRLFDAKGWKKQTRLISSDDFNGGFISSDDFNGGFISSDDFNGGFISFEK
ncbi:hypothetical protein OROGR_026282 [Orobanche gracilis]